MSDASPNPYQSPKEVASAPHGDFWQSVHASFIIPIGAALAVASLVGLVASFVPGLREFVLPRFGGIGLVSAGNPVIFIGFWFWQRDRQTLIAAAGMSLTQAIMNGVMLYAKGTTPVVTNVFLDRLPSSWLWSVASFAAIGLYLLIAAWSFPWRTTRKVGTTTQGSPQTPSPERHWPSI